LEVKHGRNLGAVRADPGQLEQVIVNLAVNARDAIQAKGADDGIVSIETFGVTPDDVRRMGSEIMPIADYTGLRVSDTGTGMSEEIKARIFDPFFTTKGVGRGTGQGLAISHAVVVEKHGGSIAVETSPGRGTTFIIQLPTAEAGT